jgi:hypothetical protein
VRPSRRRLTGRAVLHAQTPVSGVPVALTVTGRLAGIPGLDAAGVPPSRRARRARAGLRRERPGTLRQEVKARERSHRLDSVATPGHSFPDFVLTREDHLDESDRVVACLLAVTATAHGANYPVNTCVATEGEGRRDVLPEGARRVGEGAVEARSGRRDETIAAAAAKLSTSGPTPSEVREEGQRLRRRDAVERGALAEIDSAIGAIVGEVNDGLV